jgi:hypothetical protein
MSSLGANINCVNVTRGSKLDWLTAVAYGKILRTFYPALQAHFILKIGNNLIKYNQIKS